MKKYIRLFLGILVFLGFSLEFDGLRVYVSDVEEEGIISIENANEDLAANQNEMYDVAVKTHYIDLARYFHDYESSGNIHCPLVFKEAFNHSPPSLRIPILS